MPLLDTYSMRPAEATEAEAYNICFERNKVCEEFLHDSTQYNAYQTLKWLQNLPASSKRFVIEQDYKQPNFITGIPIPSIGYGRLAAVCRIDHIDLVNQTCYVGLDITEAFRSKGLSYKFWDMLLEHVFNVMNIRMTYLEVLATNKRAAHIYEKIGYKRTGFFPGKVYKQGRFVASEVFALSEVGWLKQKGYKNA